MSRDYFTVLIFWLLAGIALGCLFQWSDMLAYWIWSKI